MAVHEIGKAGKLQADTAIYSIYDNVCGIIDVY